MGIISQFQANHRAAKLREARTMEPRALTALQASLVAMGPEAIPALLPGLSHGDARGPTIEVLEQLLTKETLPEFMQALTSSNPAISSGIAKALANGRRYDATKLLNLLTMDKPAKPVLESILRERVSSIPPDRVLKLFPQLHKDGQVVVFRLLEKMDVTPVTADILRLLTHSDWWVRMNAVRILSSRNDAAVIQAITERLEDENRTVRSEALSALHRFQAKSAVPSVVGVLRDPDYMVQSAAVDFLTTYADDTVVPKLLHVLADESEYVRRGAVEVLNKVATPEAIQDLVRVLRDHDWWVRVRAADALGALGGQTVVDSMIALLRDSDEAIRRHAVEILNMVPDGRAVDALVVALDDPDWWVRERAIDTLGKTGDVRAVDPLLRILAIDETVVAICARALALIGDPRAIMPLCLWTESDREDVREEVMDALKGFLRKSISPEEKAHIQAALGRFSGPRQGARRAGPPPVGQPRAAGSLPPAGYTAGLPMRTPAPAPPVVHRPQESAAVLPVSPGGSLAGVGDVHRLEAGTMLLDRYQIVRKVGRGGYGAVYLVEDAAVGEQVILKILNPQLSFDENARQRFVRELKLTRRITHPNIIRLYDFLDLGGAHAVSMEYFPGEDLGQILAREVRLSWERGLRIMWQVCDGLAVAHGIGIVHRDLKPANLLIGDGDTLKILDFGLATPIQNPESRLTKSGLLIGTPEYMAPEQIAGEKVDARVDIYAIGIMLYEMFSGMKPYMDDTPVKVLFRHLEGDATPLAEVAPEVPAGLASLVTRTMARNPDERPPTVVDLRDEIAARLTSLGQEG